MEKGLPNLELSNEEKEFLDDVEKFITRRYSKVGKTLNNVYYNIAQPVIENPIAKYVQYLVFHTTLGRVALIAHDSLTINFVQTSNYLFGLRLNAIINYILDNVGLNSENLIISTTIVFVLTVAVSIYSGVSKKLIVDQTDGNLEVFEETYEDMVASQKDSKKKF